MYLNSFALSANASIINLTETYDVFKLLINIVLPIYNLFNRNI